MTNADILSAACQCEAAYPDDDGNSRQPKKERMESGNVYGYAHRSGGYLNLVFRGTDDPMDAFRDAQIEQVDDQLFGLCHYGALHEWRRLRPQVMKRIVKGDKVKVRGHSLGGMLAVLCTAELYHLGSLASSIECITFGQPKVFGADNDKWDDLPLTRVRNAKDRVPDQPSFWARWAYRRAFGNSVPPSKHIGKVVWTSGRPQPPWPGSISGHGITKHIEALSKEA